MAKKPQAAPPEEPQAAPPEEETVGVLDDREAIANLDTPELEVARQAEPPPEEPQGPQEILRPSVLRKILVDHQKKNGLARPMVGQTFIRENGLPNPLIRYRVMARRGESSLGPVEVEAVDTSEAHRQAAKKLGIAETNRWRFQCLVLQE